jgi:dipeptidyl aminopeptidase/acylaminoacyl peptidase
MKKSFLFIAMLFTTFAFAQNKMTPELLWSLGRLSGVGLTKDKQYAIYTVSTPNAQENKSKRQGWLVPVNGGAPIPVNNLDSAVVNEKISSDGKYIISAEEVKLQNVYGKDFYPDLQKSNAQIYTSLNYRHWDEWEDGKYSHIFVAPYNNGVAGEKKDLMPNELYDAPQKPFGGEEDYIWNPDGKHIVYVAKKKTGTAYAISTNTDLYEYDVTTGTTKNLTESNKGYDINPAYNKNGVLAWLQMKREGFEADKQDLVAMTPAGVINLTRHRDNIHVEGFKWSDDGRHLYFWAPINGTLQLFEVDYIGLTKKLPSVRQITKGDFDINNIIGQSGNKLIVLRTDMNHAAELYTVDIASGNMQQLTHVNDATYNSIGMCKIERRWVKTTDNKQMLVWVIYPPDFDPAKKYPTLLYCQGGPQSPLTQTYSFRWNFQLMASQGYIVVAPNRRGMPGHGTQWNEQVSKDWGGQVIRDYLSAIDAVRKEKYVDNNRLGCVGASFGGYSVFALEGMHNGRFKTFIAHDGVFDFRSMYGTTEEIWFVNWDLGGPYWNKNNKAAQRSYAQSPSNFVDKWNTPIMIVQGGRDYRVPIEQGLQAFQAAQLKGIKSKLLYLPDENHWVLSAQNALVWQREFFNWLDETLK